ncbi:MAG: hypothetical protein ACREU6_18535 [Steroidobacteraceae bacterium]
MPKPNYHHVKKQKELARKARQQEKQQRKAERVTTAGEPAQTSPAEGADVPHDTPSGNET